jgi:hypothetical protein
VVAVLVAVTGAVVFFATRDEPTPPTEQARESTERAREATEAPRADPSAAAHAPLPDPRAVVDDVSVPVEPQVPARVTRERGALPRRAGGAAADVERESARGAAPAEPAEATLPLASAVREEAEATRAEPRATVAEPAPDTTPETSEASLLARARRALARDPGAALAAAEEHARRFPDGILAQEREVVRIESLARLGRSDVARRRLADLERRWASSPHRARLRDLLAR